MSNTFVESLIGDLHTFRKEFWDVKPFVHRPTDPDRVSNVLSLREVDAILANPSTRPPYIEVTREGHDLPQKDWVHVTAGPCLDINDSIDVDALAAEFVKGASLLLHRLDDYHPVIRSLCAGFQDVFRAPAKSIGFVTPPGRQSLDVHYDLFQGFIVQTHGIKKWSVFDQIRPLRRKQAKLRAADLGDPVLEVTLRPGDCLYVPWGAPHYAVSQDSISCHITIMIVPPTWSEIMIELVKSAIPADASGPVPLAALEDFSSLVKRAESYLDQTISAAGRTDLQEFIGAQIRQWDVTEGKGARILEQEARQDEADSASSR